MAIAGTICLDMTPQFMEGTTGKLTEMMRPGRLNYVGPLAVSTGGAVSNVGIALVRLGATVKMMAKVGDDSLGAIVVDIASRYAPDARSMMCRGESTSYSVVLAPPGTDRVFLHHPGCNDTFSFDDIDLSALALCSVFHFGYPPLMRGMYQNGGVELIKMLGAAKKTGVTVSLDMAMFDPSSEAASQNWRSVLERALPLVDVFLPSLEECIMMMHPEDYARFAVFSDEERDCRTPELALVLAREFVDMGVAVVGIKCGALGYCIATSGRERIEQMGRAAPHDTSNWSRREIWSPGYRAETVKSSTGAGDSSIAGFLMALASGQPVEAASNAACAVGWQNLRAVDAFSGVGTWEETLEMLSRSLPRNPIRLPRGWQWNSERKVWSGPRDSLGETSGG